MICRLGQGRATLAKGRTAESERTGLCATCFKDALQDMKDKGGPNEKAHDDRPVEKRASQFKDTVEKERKQYRYQQKRWQKQ